MAVRSGFWNSVGTDIRTYYNDDFSHLISLLINDGIHQNYGKNFVVKPGSGMEVIVQSGEAWFNNSWIRSDSDLPIVVDTPPIVSGFKRIDAIAIKIDASQSVRLGSIEYVKGEETSSTPQQPTLTDTDDIHWHLLATILVSQNDTEISASKITNYIGTSSAPFITGILETVNIDILLSQWSSQFDNWMNGQEVDFMEWFDHIKDQLSEDAAGHLQNEIDEINEKSMLIQDITQAEYDALSSAEKNNGTCYNITDAHATTNIANNVAYDNTASGLNADDVQEAIDELHSDLTWKLAGRVMGNATISIPTSFHELHVVVKCPSANASPLFVIDHLINSIELNNLPTSVNNWLIGGGAISNTNHFRAITIINSSHTTISTTNVTVNNQDFSSYTITELYYR